jgi:hypothetical protein
MVEKFEKKFLGTWWVKTSEAKGGFISYLVHVELPPLVNKDVVAQQLSQ